MDKFTHTVTTNGGTTVPVVLWNPDHASLAHFFDADPADVEFREDDNGDEQVLVRGENVGKLERF